MILAGICLVCFSVKGFSFYVNFCFFFFFFFVDASSVAGYFAVINEIVLKGGGEHACETFPVKKEIVIFWKML